MFTYDKGTKATAAGPNEEVARVIDNRMDRVLYKSPPIGESANPQISEDMTVAQLLSLLGRSQIAEQKEAESTNFDEVKLSTGKFNIIPSTETERILIAAKSGCGKSTWMAKYVIEYLIKFPDRRVIMFSRHEEDPAYNGLPITYIPAKPDLVDEELDLLDLKDSLVVFDDCDNLQDKKLTKYIEKLNGDIISNGRKYNIHTAWLCHMLFNGLKTRQLLLEANKVVFFQTGQNYHHARYLREHVGLDKNQRDKILKLKTRWICTSLSMPVFVVSETQAFVA